MSEEDFKVVEKALENEEKKLNKIMEKVSKGDYDDAIDEPIETKFEIEDDVEELKDKKAVKILKTAERRQSQVHKMEEQKKKKAEEREDTFAEDKIIKKFVNELNKIKNEFKRKSEFNTVSEEEIEEDEDD